MAIKNQGAIPLEFSQRPFDVYFSFLNDLVCVPGFIAIISADRYALCLAVGRHFDGREIAQRIAQLVQQHFYPDEETIDLEFAQTIPTPQYR